MTTVRGSVEEELAFEVPKIATIGEKGELGTDIRVDVSGEDSDSVLTSTVFTLCASLDLQTVEASVGRRVEVRGQGLLPDAYYFITSVLGDNPDVAVGTLETGSSGEARGEFIVPPSIEPGEYRIQLKNRVGHYLALPDAPSLRFVGYSNSSLTIGKPVGPLSTPVCQQLVTIPVSSDLATQMTATIYALIKRNGDAVRLASSGVVLPPFGSGESTICFSDLSAGSYDVELFAGGLTGAVLSKTRGFTLKVPDRRRPATGSERVH